MHLLVVIYVLAMPDSDVCSRSPDLMQYLQSGNIVFYGAADIGKSLLVEETDDLQRIERLADLADPVAEYVALDDIYCLYQEYQSSSNQDLKERFEEVLARDYGVCLVTRSRSLDWLVTRTEFYELIDTSEFKFLARQRHSPTIDAARRTRRPTPAAPRPANRRHPRRGRPARRPERQLRPLQPPAVRDHLHREQGRGAVRSRR